MKIGVLYPRSQAYPDMLVDFNDGIKLALKHYKIDNNIELITHSIGNGGDEREVFEKTEKLLLLDDVDLLIAYIDVRVISKLDPLLTARKKLMIVVNPGANYLGNQPAHPYIVHLTLQHGFLCWLTGLLGSNDQKEGAAMATSFYDAGYLHIAAITTGYINNGGSITYNYVNNNRYDDTFEIKPLTDFLSAEKKTQKLLCVFDVKPACIFLDKLNQYEGSTSLQLFASPMMLDSKAWEKTDKGLNFSIGGYLPYHAAAANTANVEFRDIFTSHTKREPSVFALLGWESAAIITAVFNNCKSKYADGELITAFLKTSEVHSPRGGLKLDAETNIFVAPVFKAHLKNYTRTVIVTPVTNVAPLWDQFMNIRLEGHSSGWSNTYLCY
jgi:branched-chain amino acid transport system substrate-binding protein